MGNENGDIHCCLIFGKSRVTPVKYVSIPRLELTPATLSVKISMMLKEELDIHITSESFWADSQVVLGYLNNESRRFIIFVVNRVQFIGDHTDVQQWQYVLTHDNPADDASRGLDSKNMSKIQRWFNGPAFLWSSEKTWLCDKQSIQLGNVNDPELKNKLQLNIVKADITVKSKLKMISSSWIRIRKVMAVVPLAANVWIKRRTKPRPPEITTLINMELLEKARKMIFKMLQEHSFSHEIYSLKSNTTLHRSSNLFKLRSFPRY